MRYILGFVFVYLIPGAVIGAGIPVLAEAVAPDSPSLTIPLAVLFSGIAIALALAKLSHSMGKISGELITKVDTLIIALDKLTGQVDEDGKEHREAIKTLRSDLESQVGAARSEFAKGIGSVRNTVADLERWQSEQKGAEKARLGGRKSA